MIPYFLYFVIAVTEIRHLWKFQLSITVHEIQTGDRQTDGQQSFIIGFRCSPFGNGTLEISSSGGVAADLKGFPSKLDRGRTSLRKMERVERGGPCPCLGKEQSRLVKNTWKNPTDIVATQQVINKLAGENGFHSRRFNVNESLHTYYESRL